MWKRRVRGFSSAGPPQGDQRLCLCSSLEPCARRRDRIINEAFASEEMIKQAATCKN